MFGRATIRLGIGPHSSLWHILFVVHKVQCHRRKAQLCGFTVSNSGLLSSTLTQLVFTFFVSVYKFNFCWKWAFLLRHWTLTCDHHDLQIWRRQCHIEALRGICRRSFRSIHVVRTHTLSQISQIFPTFWLQDWLHGFMAGPFLISISVFVVALYVIGQTIIFLPCDF